MAAVNRTTVTHFILLGFTEVPELQVFLFLIFLLVYTVTVVGNIGIIFIINYDLHLRSPMYFFLGHLSFIDLCYSSGITPKMLMSFVTVLNAISFCGCVIQLFSFALFGTTECVLLTVMAYDRYVAVCDPLMYSTIMTKQLCYKLVILSYILSIFNSSLNTICTFAISSFCGPTTIHHFYCDFLPLLKLSCSDTLVVKLVLFTSADFLTMSALGIIVASYASIICNILRIHSTDGRRKAFSTCTSHFSCVLMFYGTILFMYLRPSTSNMLDQDRVASILYTVIIPMLNPLIYTLRNKEVKQALQKNWQSLCNV
ncbi:olfactory receptor 1038-like [Bombina bombina]|uniref:olfactory receptor 1038-like n=1 Tax=Bombina bombina TaxID=8345 RepID=UPI00235A9340|nr:olfactory receptor 1038-like [Bombina bombina]